MASTTVIFTVSRGSGRVLVNSVAVTFGQAVTVTNGANVMIIRISGEFSVNIQNTGSEQFTLAGVTVAAGQTVGGYAYRSGNYTAIVGSGIEPLFPQGKWQDMITSAVIDNAKFFTYSSSSLVNSDIRGPKILALDTSTAIFKFVIIYIDYTSQQVKGLPFTYDSESGTFTYGVVTVIRPFPIIISAISSFIDAILIDSTRFMIGYCTDDVNYPMEICLISFSGLTITPVSFTTSPYFYYFSLYIGGLLETTRLKYLSPGKVLVIGLDETSTETYASVVSITGDSLSVTSASIMLSGVTVDEYTGGFEIISETSFVACSFGPDLSGPYNAVVYSITSFSPLTIVKQNQTVLINASMYPAVQRGVNNVIKLGNGNYVFYNVIDEFINPRSVLTLASYSGNFTVLAQIESTTYNFSTVAPLNGANFLIYGFLNNSEILYKYDTTANNFSSLTSLDMSISNTVAVSFLTFGDRFVTCNIYNNTTFAIISGKTNPLTKLTNFRPVYLKTRISSLVPTTPGNTIAVTLFPSSTYYSHTENGRVSESNSATPGSIDDKIVTIGTTNSNGTLLTFS